jgi:hypothetical protein
MSIQFTPATVIATALVGTTLGVGANVAVGAATGNIVLPSVVGFAGLAGTGALMATHAVSRVPSPMAKTGLSLLGFTGVGLGAGILGGVTAAQSPIFGHGRPERG